MSATFWPWDLGPCARDGHGRDHGPCTDVGQCGGCGSPVPVMRPAGETYGFHADDCASPERHYGACEPRGAGHPVGVVRGGWPGMDDDIERARAPARKRHPHPAGNRRTHPPRPRRMARMRLRQTRHMELHVPGKGEPVTPIQFAATIEKEAE